MQKCLQLDAHMTHKSQISKEAKSQTFLMPCGCLKLLNFDKI